MCVMSIYDEDPDTGLPRDKPELPVLECPTCGCRLGKTVRTLVDRSLGFTCMLELYPGFGRMPDTEGMGITTAFLEDWYRSGHTNMFEYAREWVARHKTYCTRGHQPGEHDASCMPPADPANPELRLLRAIYGLCSLCDRTDEHEHPDEELLAHGMVPDSSEARETFCGTCGHLDTPGVHLFAECPRFNDKEKDNG